MTLIIGGICLLILTVVLERIAPRPRYEPPARIRSTLVDYSMGRAEIYGALGRAAPEMAPQAVLGLYGRPVYESVMREVAATMVRHPGARFDAGSSITSLFEETTLPTELATTDGPQPVFFKEGEPKTLDEYEGQAHIVEYLKAVIDSMDATEIVPREHQLFLGPPGLGKTLLAKCFINSLAERNKRLGLEPVWFQEEFPADLPDLKKLDQAILRASERPTALFIDEIHDLRTEGHALKLYLLLEEGRYKFEGSDFPATLPNVLVLGATTDYGALHPALQRRFNRHAMMALSKDQIAGIVHKGRGLPITPEATVALVERTHFSGAPWEAIQLYRQATKFAKQRQAAQVQVEDVERVFQSQQIDALGLRWMDRSVLRVLLGQPKYRNGRGSAKEFVCYAASESDTCQMAQVDRGEYRESIKPRLMARGLLQVRATYGQALTPKAVTSYGWLVKE